ncbi:DsbA family protein, partial [Mesorhizobium sp. M7A.F.Ca.CA.004.05.2.1]
MSNSEVTYLFDPLCGWCYGATPMLDRLSAA